MDENKVQEQRRQTVRQFWNSEAATFDNEPDHGLRDPLVRQAWTNLLARWLPPAPAPLLDVGCGTGSLSLVLAELGHQVTGIDFSAAMIALARKKAARAGRTIPFLVRDASALQLPGQQFAAIVCRHLLWALPDPAVALQHWSKLLRPGGRLLLVEGFWHTGGGLHAAQVASALPAAFTVIAIEQLGKHATLWGAAMDDERYIVVAARSHKTPDNE
jgi:ubiquinone/menaquinone biosynthesis C-methylase UbiE